MRNPRALILPVLAIAILLVGPPPIARAAGDVVDQFFRYTEKENRVFFQQMPGESVDPFTGTLRIVQEDLALPGKAGLDVHVIRSYSSKIWGRADLLDLEPLLAEKEHSVLGYGWSFHFGRLKNPNASGQSGNCSGDFPIFEAPDGTARVFYPTAASNTVFTSKDYWRMEKNCSALGGAGACIWSDTGIRYEFSSASGNSFYYGGTIVVWPVSAVVDSFGNQISVNYVQDQSGAVSGITDTYGRSITFGYVSGTDGKRLDTMTANGHQYHYIYTTYTSSQTGGAGKLPLPGSRRFLTEVRPPAGPSYSYQYGYSATIVQNQYALTAITYPSGGTTTYGYDAATFFTGRDSVPFSVATQRSMGGRDVISGNWMYSYDSPGSGTAMHVTTITRPDGKQDTYTIYGFGYVAGKNATGSTWMVGLAREIARADRAEVETYTWDPNSSNPRSTAVYSAPVYSSTCGPYFVWDTAVYSPVLTQRDVTRDGSTYATVYKDFDSYGQAKTVNETGQLTRATTWTYFYAPKTSGGSTLNMVRGRPLTEHVCVASDCFDNRWTYNGPSYARDSETLTSVGTAFGYDSFGNLHTVTNALGEVFTLSGYDVGNGTPTSLDFNAAYTVTRTTSWEGWINTERNGRGYTTTYAYDAIGRIKTLTPPGTSSASTYTHASDGSSLTLTRGNYVKTTNLDGVGRVISTSDSEGVLTSQRYDNMGRNWFKSYPYDASSGEVGDRLIFDGLGRATTQTKAYRPATNACDVAGACNITNSYSNNCVTTTVQRATGDNPLSVRCSKSFGSPDEQKLNKLTDANGNVWQYGYNAYGSLQTVIAPIVKGNQTFTYDAATQFLKSEFNEESGTTTYSRNAVGQAKTRTDARPITTTYGYDDPLSRLRSTTYDTGSADDVVRNYDNANNLINISTTNGGTFGYSYDEVNRPISQTWTYNAHSYTTTYHYNASGCLDSLTYPTGTTLIATCDTANRVTSLSLGGSNIVSAISYHPSSQIRSMTYGNAKATSVTYDDRGRAKTITASGVIDLAYGYDGADNVISFDNAAVAGASRTMTYDKLDRLHTSMAPGLWGIATYDYDELGNRTRKSMGNATRTYIYDSNNRLASATGYEPTTTMSFTWDLAGGLATSSDGASYAYDGRGKRVKRVTSSETTLYHYDPSGKLLAESETNGAKLRDYIYVGERLIAVDGCITGAACTERQWYHTDALGTVLARSNGAGAVVARFDYQPWGELWSSGGAKGDRQYNGRVRDLGTGFYDYGARMYWPEIGRFLSPDTSGRDLENPIALNEYAYVNSNPYKYVDPTGKVALVLARPFDYQKADLDLIKKASATINDQNASRFDKAIAWAKLVFAEIDLTTPPIGPGMVKWRVPGSGIVGGATRSIVITESGFAHVAARHMPGGAMTAGKSLFAVSENVAALIRAAEEVAPTLQKGGSFERIIDAGRIIGVDRATGPTSIYSVITDSAGKLITAFPGTP